jgi:hypothetical protein
LPYQTTGWYNARGSWLCIVCTVLRLPFNYQALAPNKMGSHGLRGLFLGRSFLQRLRPYINDALVAMSRPRCRWVSSRTMTHLSVSNQYPSTRFLDRPRMPRVLWRPELGYQTSVCAVRRML